ncbi:hypothetical protein [uncultured Propionibacterium sp.]|uniref:C40 family peptidase n=1 Tax=uncultured Propionibacterium sp. TaxID=218066 RepID=UPI0029319E1B|nr:hypothetical protein [uncultured Propionibacterium sp.]
MSARRALVEQPAGTLSAPLALTAATTARRAMTSVPARRALENGEFIAAPAARRALAESLEAIAPPRARRAAEPVVPVALTIDGPGPERAFIKADPAPRRRRGNSRFMAAGLGLAAVIGTVSGGLAITNSAMASGTATPQDVVATEAETIAIDPASTEPDPAAETPAVVEVEPITVEISTPVDPAGVTAPGQKTPLSTAAAIEKAKSMVGNQDYGNMCLALSAAFYGYSSAGVNSATDAAATIQAAGQMHTDMTNIPVGALIWYDGGPSGNPYGHVAMYAGDGMIYSNGAPTGVGLIPINEPADGWHEPIIGWSTVWLPSATS